MWRKGLGITLFVIAVCLVGYLILPGHQQRGRQFMQDKDFEKSIAEYERALQRRTDTDSTDILDRLADLYAREDRKHDAITMLQRLIAIIPDNPDYLARLADLYQWDGQNKNWTRTLETLARLKPKDEETLRQLADSYGWNQSEQNRSKAISVYERLVQLKPKDITAHETLAEYYEWNKQYDRSAHVYKELTELVPGEYRYWNHLAELHRWENNNDAAINIYGKMRTRFPDRVDVLDALGKVYAATTQGLAAARTFEEYLVARPEDRLTRELVVVLYEGESMPMEALVHREYLWTNFPDKANYRTGLIQAYKAAFLHDRLIRLYETERTSDPDNPTRLDDLAHAYVDAGRVDDAITMLQEALESGQTAPETFDLLAKLQQESLERAASITTLFQKVKQHPGDVDALRTLAERLMESQRVDEAVGSYEQLLGLKPDDATARRALVEIYTTRRLPVKAIAHAEAYHAAHPNDPAILLRLSDLHAWTGNYRAAAEIYRHLVAGDPTDPEKHDHLAALYTKNNHHLGAIQQWAEAIRLAPSDLGYRLSLADAYARHKDRDGRIVVLAAIVKQFPVETNHKIVLAKALSEVGRYDEAITQYRALLADDPKNVLVKLQLAHTYQHAGQMSRAMTVHRELLAWAVETKDPSLLNAIGNRYVEIRDRHNAGQFFAMALTLDPNNLEAIKQMGTLAAWNNDLVQAQEYYMRFIAQGGKDFEIHFLLGELYYDGDLPGQAYAQHEIALELMAQNPIDLNGRLSLARILFRRGNLVKAIALHETLIRENPADAAVMEDYLETMVLARQYQRAEGVAMRLAAEFPDSARGQRLLGRIYLETERYEKAAGHLRMILDQHPNDSALKLDLARAYIQIGLTPKALPLFQQVRNEGGDTHAAIRAIRDQYATSVSTEFSFLDGPRTMTRFRERTTFRHWLRDDTRMLAWLDLSHYNQNARPGSRKINDTVAGRFIRFDRDLTRSVRVYGGLGLERHGTDEQGSYLGGVIWTPFPEHRAELSHTGNRRATAPVEFLNVGGTEDRTALDTTMRVSDDWRLLNGWAYSRYTIDRSENTLDRSSKFGDRHQLYTQAERIWIDQNRHYLSTSYRFSYSRFREERGDFDTLVPILSRETAHTGILRWEHQHTRKTFHGVSLFAGYDPARTQPVFGGELEVEHRFTERLKGRTRARYLTESSRESGGTEYEITVGLEWTF